MIHKIVAARDTFGSWRNIARDCARARLKPAEINWSFESARKDDLFASLNDMERAVPADIGKVPRRFLELARKVVCHNDSERFAILYELLLVCMNEPNIFENSANPLIHKTSALAKSVSRDMHKMKAFVRFRENTPHTSERRKFTAWFEPEHYIVEENAAFFMRRFNDMDWMIATPKGSAWYANTTLTFDPSPATQIKAEDDTENLWKTYYANIFNPARLKLTAMRSEMPKKYWRNLPEAVLIKELVSNASHRVDEMRGSQPTTPSPFAAVARAPTVSSQEILPDQFKSIADLNIAARKCQRCPLYCNSTQTIVGEGPDSAKLMLVGEQPGDQEDILGRSFVGPAGKLFDQALLAAGILRESIYVTNAVKHFKFEPRGKRRIHMRPNAGEIQYCKYWLIHEISLIRPKLILAMGATASEVLTGSDQNMGARRGTLEYPKDFPIVMTTYHPAAILRAKNHENSIELKTHFFSDIAKAGVFVSANSLPP